MNSGGDGLVSVIIPTHYRNDDLQRAIETALNQDYGAVEVIVVDDSGEAYAKEIVDTDRVTYIAHDENRGANAARNTGIERSNGDYLQLLDDDDQMDERKLRIQVAKLQSRDDVGVVYCGLQHSTGEYLLPDPTVRGDVLESALSFDMYSCMTSTMLLKRDVIEQIHPLTVRPSADDLGFMIELAQITTFDYVDEILVHKAVRRESRGKGVTNARERLRIIREYRCLYDHFPRRVRQETQSETYHRLGAQLLNEHVWSAMAVWAYWKALLHNPDPGLTHYLSCLMVLFGRPGRTIANAARQRITDSE